MIERWSPKPQIKVKFFFPLPVTLKVAFHSFVFLPQIGAKNEKNN